MKLPFELNLQSLLPRSRQRGAALVGLALDAGRLEVVQVRRTNGSVEIQKRFSATLTLDPLTDAPELVGREIRKALDAEGVRERACVVGIPLNWALTLTVKLPALPEEDLASFLQLEAERGFPYGQDALLTASSRFTSADGQNWATLIAVPRTHVARLEEVLAAALLRPASFSLGIAALQPPQPDAAEGVLALVPGENNVRLQLTVGGGIAVLRTIEGAFELAGAARQLEADHVSREVRITLGQLAPELREAVKRVRVFGRSDDADELAEVLAPRLEAQGLALEQVPVHAPGEFDLKLPVNTPVSAALAMVMRRLAGQKTPFEFLPPKVSAWQQFSSKYSSPRLVTVGATAGAVVAVVFLAFFVQQTLLWYWGHRWNNIKERVFVLEDTQANLRRYRPWYDTSFRELSILRRLTEAFPQEGTVSAKQIEIRDPNKPGELVTVTCTGTARSRTAYAQVKDRLAKARNVVEIHTQQERGNSPIEFTFDFKWSEGQ
jgi:hypothetical protein